MMMMMMRMMEKEKEKQMEEKGTKKSLIGCLEGKESVNQKRRHGQRGDHSIDKSTH